MGFMDFLTMLGLTALFGISAVIICGSWTQCFEFLEKHLEGNIREFESEGGLAKTFWIIGGIGGAIALVFYLIDRETIYPILAILSFLAGAALSSIVFGILYAITRFGPYYLLVCAAAFSIIGFVISLGSLILGFLFTGFDVG